MEDCYWTSLLIIIFQKNVQFINWIKKSP